MFSCYLVKAAAAAITTALQKWVMQFEFKYTSHLYDVEHLICISNRQMGHL